MYKVDDDRGLESHVADWWLTLLTAAAAAILKSEI
jgi:hypothetical protein